MIIEPGPRSVTKALAVCVFFSLILLIYTQIPQYLHQLFL